MILTIAAVFLFKTQKEDNISYILYCLLLYLEHFQHQYFYKISKSETRKQSIKLKAQNIFLHLIVQI